jgi:hypothetical protein
MKSVIIDYKNIIKKDSELSKKIKIPEKFGKGFEPVLILILENDSEKRLSEKSPGKDRVEYINNSTDFVNYYYIYFNPKRKIIFLGSDILKYLEIILSSLFTGMDTTSLLIVNIPLESKNFNDTVDAYIDFGFSFPHIETTTPMLSEIKPSLILSKRNIKEKDIDNSKKTLIKNKLQYILSQYEKNNGCELWSKLSDRALNFLKEASHLGIVIEKNGDKSQREISGELFVKGIDKDVNRFIYIIDIDKSSVESGEEENVNVKGTRYNFHSHPKEAYVRHSVHNAWPSVTDYMGYLHLGSNTIFHCVATLEGLYIISFSKYWGERLKEVSKKFVDKNFEIDHKEPITPKQYVETVNNILYKGYPIYEVKYFPWKEAGQVFKVSFSRTGKTCLATEKCVQNYKKIYGGK